MGEVLVFGSFEFQELRFLDFESTCQVQRNRKKQDTMLIQP